MNGRIIIISTYIQRICNTSPGDDYITSMAVAPCTYSYQSGVPDKLSSYSIHDTNGQANLPYMLELLY